MYIHHGSYYLWLHINFLLHEVMRIHVVTTSYCHVVLAIVTHFKWFML